MLDLDWRCLDQAGNGAALLKVRKVQLVEDVEQARLLRGLVLRKQLVHLAVDRHQEDLQVDCLLAEEDILILAHRQQLELRPHSDESLIELMDALLHDLELDVLALQPLGTL